MAPKKRRLSSAEDESPSTTPQIKRKKKQTIQYDPMEFCQELYETIRNHKTEDGRLLCEPFIRVPKRRTEPEYYDAVSTPIDILKIQHKLKSEEYEDIEQLTSDIELMVNNAKAYYKKTTPEYKDACDLWDLYMDTKNILMAEVFGELEGGTDPSSSERESKEGTPGMADDDRSSVITEDGEESHYEQLFSAVFLAKDGDRFISEMFKLLPSRTAYPEYYEIIKNPMDLKMAAQKIVDNEYTDLDDLFKDLNLIVSNARAFNEPGSQIYKDALTLKKMMLAKKKKVPTATLR